MSSSPTSIRNRAQSIAKAAWEAQKCGDFERGLLHFSTEWAKEGYLPDTEDLPPTEAAELLLRFGSLVGFQGHFRKIKNSQLRARNILTNALLVFDNLRDEARAAECENHIALTYSRTGEYGEARAWLDAAMSRPIGSTDIQRLASIMYAMLIDVGEQKYGDILKKYNEFEQVFRDCTEDWVGACFYSNAGVGFMEAGRPQDAIRCFEIATYRAKHSSIRTYLASLQNELAHVYSSIGQYQKAHEHVDRGIELYRELGDLSREGLLLDTKSAIFLSQGDLENALKTIDSAIGILRDGENQAFLAEAFATKAKILIWLDDFSDAAFALSDAIQLAHTYCGREFAKSLASQFEATVKEKNAGKAHGSGSANGLEHEELKLVLPPEMVGHRQYQGIRINNENLQCVGVEQGDLVIAAEADGLVRGDLVAVKDIGSGEISCGFYDLDFGILCLETCDTEPTLFDQDEVEIIGKIVGIADEPDADGMRRVRPIDERPSLPEV